MNWETVKNLLKSTHQKWITVKREIKSKTFSQMELVHVHKYAEMYVA